MAYAKKIKRLPWQICKPSAENVRDYEYVWIYIEHSFYWATELEKRIKVFEAWKKLIMDEMTNDYSEKIGFYMWNHYTEVLEYLVERMSRKLRHPMFGKKRKKFTNYVSLRKPKKPESDI